MNENNVYYIFGERGSFDIYRCELKNLRVQRCTKTCHVNFANDENDIENLTYEYIVLVNKVLTERRLENTIQSPKCRQQAFRRDFYSQKIAESNYESSSSSSTTTHTHTHTKCNTLSKITKVPIGEPEVVKNHKTIILRISPMLSGEGDRRDVHFPCARHPRDDRHHRRSGNEKEREGKK